MPDIIDQTFLKSNIIDEEEAKYEIKEALHTISDNVSKSLGPYGSTTIVEDRQGDHFMTKDGYTILKKMEFYNDIPKTVLDIVKKVSKSLVRTVGDGSTSAVVIATELFDGIETLLKDTDLMLAPQDIITILNVLSEILEDEILKKSNKITDENFYKTIEKIATISTNNDKECGKLFADIFSEIGRYGFINLEHSKTSKDHYEKVQGIEINRGWINQRMANKEDNINFEYEKPLIFMSNDMLTDDEMDFVAKLLDTYCLRKNEPLVIIAPSYSSSFKTFFDANLQKNRHLPVVAIDIDYNSTQGKERFHDLALALNCTVYDKYSGLMTIEDLSEKLLGGCGRIIGNDMHTTFISGNGYKKCKDDIDKRINELNEEYEKLSIIDSGTIDKEKELFNIKKRIATLSNSMATLYVGGNSEMEKVTRKFLMEDAVYACRSSIEYGWIVGGNLIVPKIVANEDSFKYILSELNTSERLSYLRNIDYSENEKYHTLTDVYEKVLLTVFGAFIVAYTTVIKNAYINQENVTNIIEKCLLGNIIYNVKTRSYETEEDTIIINSAQTDIEIIKASFSIIGLLATSNQFLTTNPISLKR